MLFRSGACENPKSSTSIFLFGFEKTIRSGSLEEFVSKLFVDPRTDLTRVTPDLISDVDGTKMKLAEAKEFLNSYLSSRKIDYAKTTSVVSATNTSQSLTDQNGVIKKYMLKAFHLKDSEANSIIDIDLWTREDGIIAVGDVTVYSKLP